MVVKLIINIFVTVTSILSLFIEIKKIPMSVRAFLAIASSVTLVDLVMSMWISDDSIDNKVAENIIEESYVQETIVQETINKREEVVKHQVEGKEDKMSKDTSSAEIWQVEKIVNVKETIEDIPGSTMEVSGINVDKLSGNIYTEKQVDEYEFVPAVSGVHRFEFSDVPEGTDLRLRILNAGRESMDYCSDADNGDGLTKNMEAGHMYYLCVEQYENVGVYTLNIGRKKELVDISGLTTVTDSIQYTDQENDYVFVPDMNGRYRFEFSNVPDGTDLRLGLYNSGWERLETNSDMDTGDGRTWNLEKGCTYYIRVSQYENVGSYTLNIGRKKELVDISSLTAVTDKIQYTDQENDYMYTPQLQGAHRFEFSDVPDGTDLRLSLYNAGWERLETNSDMDSGDGKTWYLETGRTYYIRVSQYENVGQYTLNIGRKKEVVDITYINKLSDSMQYTEQQNDYLFIPNTDKNYTFSVKNMPEEMEVRISFYNSGWERMTYSTIENGESWSADLEKGKTYYIQVSQYQALGDYILEVQ